MTVKRDEITKKWYLFPQNLFKSAVIFVEINIDERGINLVC